mmetsp:Transcript_27126/g.48674  ORF Transcript_27126/g.48674 Transcript_27126/m.48674 type:complete len:279 (-) Transcript_27126:1178-2014(-)
MPRKKKRNYNKNTIKHDFASDSDEGIEHEGSDISEVTLTLSDMISTSRVDAKKIRKKTDQFVIAEDLDSKVENLRLEYARLTAECREESNKHCKLNAEYTAFFNKRQDKQGTALESRNLLRVELDEKLVELKSTENEISDIRSLTQELEKAFKTVTKEIEVLHQEIEEPYLEDQIAAGSQKLMMLESGDFSSLSFKEKLDLFSKLTVSLNTCTERLKHNANKQVEDLDLQCEICYDGPRNAVTFPCNHFLMCTSCAHIVDSCPFCLEPIKKIREVNRG